MNLHTIIKIILCALAVFSFFIFTYWAGYGNDEKIEYYAVTTMFFVIMIQLERIIEAINTKRD